MPERERMLLDGGIVTVIEVHGHGKNAKVTIRNPYGFEEIVKASRLKPLADDDPLKKYRFASAE